MRAARATAEGASRVSRPLDRSEKATSGLASAARVTVVAAARPSPSGLPRNFRRAGVRAKSFSTSTSDPRGRAAGFSFAAAPATQPVRNAYGHEPSQDWRDMLYM